jgi:hypothetical protein
VSCAFSAEAVMNVLLSLGEVISVVSCAVSAEDLMNVLCRVWL